ncbi:MAG TPA: calcium/sodium antiporter [Levilinea sp.]|nr:calcium/sodium antiporter [Levilinea sp.]
MVWMILIYLAGGLVTLIVGAEGLVRGASRLAAALGISPLVIGLTVVAFGTSSPELAVSVQAALRGSADVAIGNVVGSNIFNILFILGASALIAPLIVHSQLLRLDVPLMVGASALMFILALDGLIGLLDGLLLISCLVLYTWWSVRQSRNEPTDVQDEYGREFSATNGGWRKILKNLLFIAVGLGLLVVGSGWLVKGAVALAHLFNVSDLVIGLTIVAIGTSLPEVATSIVAALKQERDIAVGNVVGSNIFNILAVIGLSGLIAPAGVQVSQIVLQQDIPIMIAVAALMLPIFFTGQRIARWEGALLLVYWVAYTAYLVFVAIRFQAGASTLTGVMLWVILPVSLLIVAVNVLREWRRRDGKPAMVA